MAHSTQALTNAEYRQVKVWSNSDLSMINKSAALIEWSRNAPSSPSSAVDIGTATHSAVLEPESFISDYVKMPSFDKRTKVGKEGAELFEQNMVGKEVISDADYTLVTDMRDSVMAHPVAKKLLTLSGESELSVFFEVDGIKCKARFDRKPDHEALGFHCIVDLKTTGDMSKFKYSVRDYRYHCQAAWYRKAYFELTGFMPRFIFVVVSKQKTFGKHEVRVFELSQEDLEEGWLQCESDIEKIKEFEEFGVGMDVEILSLPKKW